MPNCKEEEIDRIIKLIPNSYITNKDDLLVICRIFGYYGRYALKTCIGNCIKLFERIIEPIKKHLQDQSSFFWDIFGGLNLFKLWMYEEGLITIDVIIQSAALDTSNTILEYFLPEIIEKEPFIYNMEFKKRIKTPPSIEFISEFKEIRKKLFEWYRQSNDFNDPLYREIEKDPLRLAIKTDDIGQFQSILSNLNTPINSEISESVLEQSLISKTKSINFIDYAIEYNSIKIFKYLIMNDAELTVRSDEYSIYSRNYEI